MRWFGWFRSEPIPVLDLTPYQGNWVAVKANAVVAHAPSAFALMEILTSSEKFKGSTCWFEEFPHKVLRWSVQYASRPGYVYPNCLFTTRESAEWWLKSWPGHDGDVGSIFIREGQHEPWVAA